MSLAEFTEHPFAAPCTLDIGAARDSAAGPGSKLPAPMWFQKDKAPRACLLYTSDAADE